MSRDPACLSDMDLDVLRLAGREELHVVGCEVCSARFAELASSSSAFEARFSAAGLAAETLDRRDRRARRSWPQWSWAAGVAVAAAVLLAVVGLPIEQPPVVEDRLKGGAGLMVYVQRAHEVHLAQDGDDFVAGDAVMFKLHPGPHAYGTVVGIEASGKLTVYVDGMELSAGWSESPRSVVLDDAPGAERLYALYSDDPIDPSVIEEAARHRDVRSPAELVVPGVRAQASFLMRKKP